MDPQNIEKFRAAEKHLWDHYGVQPVERFLHLPGLNINVRAQEAGQGEPVLFIHGSPNAGSKWAPLVARLPGFRCLVLDRPGCGLSDPVDYSRLDLRAFAVDLGGQVLDALGLPRAALVASSLGGALAFYFTQACPERVARLVQEGCPALVRGFRVPAYNLLSSALSLLTGRSPASLPAFRQLGHAGSIDRGRFELEVLTWRDALLKYTDTARNEDALQRHLLPRMRRCTIDEAFLRQVQTPTLYLWGESDPFGGVALGRRLAAAQPYATLHSFPDSGHLPWLDDPGEHARRVNDFLRA